MSEFLSIRDLICQVRRYSYSVRGRCDSFICTNKHAREDRPVLYQEDQLKVCCSTSPAKVFPYRRPLERCIFRYLRELAIRYKNQCVLISCDDKAKVSFGEPGNALSTGVRGKDSLVPASSILGALDHDVDSKG